MITDHQDRMWEKLTKELRVGECEFYCWQTLRRPRKQMPLLVNNMNSRHVADTNIDKLKMLARHFQSYKEVDVNAPKQTLNEISTNKPAGIDKFCPI